MSRRCSRHSRGRSPSPPRPRERVRPCAAALAVVHFGCVRRLAIVAIVLGCSSGAPADAPETSPEPAPVVAAPDVGSAVIEPAPVPEIAAPAPAPEPEPEPVDDGWQRGEVGDGDSLSRILARANVPANV